MAFCNVPKITVIIGASYGAGNYGMCGRAYEPRFLFMWPNAKIAVMGGEQAASVLSEVASKKFKDEGEKREFEEKIKEKYEKESHCYYSSARI